MDQTAVLARFDLQMRQNVQPEAPGARVERIGPVVRHVGAGPDDWNGVVWSDLDDASADAAIAAQVDHFASLGREFEWKLYGYDGPVDLGRRLEAAGFVPEAEETLMIAEISRLSVDATLPEGIRLEPVTDEAGVDLVADVHEQAFGTSAARLRRSLLSQLAGNPDTFSMVIAMADDRPVCAARMELNPGTDFVGLWGGGTVPDWRGRGIYRALVAHRARIAGDLGYRYLQVDASDQSRPILQRLGFAALSTTTPYAIQP